MQVNPEKTKLLAQLPPNQATQVANAQISDHPVESVDNFTYLGSILSRTVTSEKNIENWIKAAHSAYGRLAHRVFTNHGLTMHTKIMVFRSVVLSTLLYVCETWTLYKRDVKRLESFLHIHWMDCITNNEVLSRAALPSVEATILQHRLRWVGHVGQMEPSRLPKIILFGELAHGKRPRGAPKRRYKDQLKLSLTQAGIPPTDWEDMAQDRSVWRQAVKSGVEGFETHRRERDKQRSEERKAKATQPQPPSTLPCDSCPRLFRHRLGLLSHIRHRHGGTS
ncbi:uncharacterized protein LOC143030020 [Oratosquilla oratoria]|uniref:uncharacterized protein LOC143030020 n=1 Tax=Oratosquilla oratoria TaxID=337810 RepID=UPI003F769A11